MQGFNLVTCFKCNRRQNECFNIALDMYLNASTVIKNEHAGQRNACDNLTDSVNIMKNTNYTLPEQLPFLVDVDVD